LSARTQAPNGSSERGRRRSWLWIAGVAGLIVVGLGIVGCSDDEDQPTLSFDGTAATYRGPTTLDAGEITFLLENDSDIEVVFVWGRHREEGHSADETIAWNDENPGVPPPWVEEARDIGNPVPAGSTTEQSVELQPGPHDLLAFDGDAYVGWIATVVQVAGG
jgi:hypothetical protein